MPGPNWLKSAPGKTPGHLGWNGMILRSRTLCTNGLWNPVGHDRNGVTLSRCRKSTVELPVRTLRLTEQRAKMPGTAETSSGLVKAARVLAPRPAQVTLGAG